MHSIPCRSETLHVIQCVSCVFEYVCVCVCWEQQVIQLSGRGGASFSLVYGCPVSGSYIIYAHTETDSFLEIPIYAPI
jgi:hypothetical protein